MKITHDHVDQYGQIKVAILDGDFQVVFRLSVAQADALAESLLEEGIAWRAERERQDLRTMEQDAAEAHAMYDIHMWQQER